jgi:PKD repeat protein
MKRTLLPLFFVSSVLIFSCSKDDEYEPDIIVGENRPYANYSIKSTDDPFTFEFVNESERYKSIEWRFGDDSLSYEENPVHQYFRPGKYEVNLKVIAEDGSTARKLLNINIVADSLAEFKAIKEPTSNEVRFSASAKFPVKSVEWNFGDNTKSTELSPLKTYNEGFFGTASVVLTAENNAQVTLSRAVTSLGSLSPSLFASIPGAFEVSHQSMTSAGELFEKIYDGLTNTKFLTTFSSTNTVWMQWSPERPTVSDFYTITSANDVPERDPRKWVLQGSMDGVNFVTLDERENETFANRFQTKLYTFNNDVAYNHYRLHILEHRGNTYLQIAEWTMYKTQ